MGNGLPAKWAPYQKGASARKKSMDKDISCSAYRGSLLEDLIFEFLSSTELIKTQKVEFL